MKTKTFSFLFFILFCIFTQAFAQDIVAGDVTQPLDKEMQEAILRLEPWLKDAQAVQMGPWKIYRPNEEKSSKLWVVAPSASKHLAIDENSIAVVFKNSAGGISIHDNDNDGIFEALSYEILNPQGGSAGTVYDWDRDGEADLKVMFSGEKNAPPKVFVKLFGQWEQIIRKDGRSWVLIEGEMKEVKKEGPKYILVK